jgi:GTP cyclohydrolase FolE2
MNDCCEVAAMPDVQNYADTRELAINKVGIKSIRHPVRIPAAQFQGHAYVTLCRDIEHARA